MTKSGACVCFPEKSTKLGKPECPACVKSASSNANQESTLLKTSKPWVVWNDAGMSLACTFKEKYACAAWSSGATNWRGPKVSFKRFFSAPCIVYFSLSCKDAAGWCSSHAVWK